MDEETVSAIRLRMNHPNIDPAVITGVMRLQPDRSWKAGEQRLTPVGTVLPGVHRSSYWNYTRHLTKNEELSALLASLLESISANKNFIKEINSSGGNIEIDIQFNGGIHSGDIFRWEQLAILSELNINLGMEVFPNWNS